ncbi:MAG: hypothetical protein IIU52_00780, partial [Bacteroidaceae bacterium]|nr:hypothetical protein [Bacteroidaceae bacterium]
MEEKYISAGGRGLCAKGWHTNHYTQLNVADYNADIPNNTVDTDLVEVQFKNTRKGYYHNSNGLELCKGDTLIFRSNIWEKLSSIRLMASSSECLFVVYFG